MAGLTFSSLLRACQEALNIPNQEETVSFFYRAVTEALPDSETSNNGKYGKPVLTKSTASLICAGSQEMHQFIRDRISDARAAQYMPGYFKKRCVNLSMDKIDRFMAQMKYCIQTDPVIDEEKKEDLLCHMEMDSFPILVMHLFQYTAARPGKKREGLQVLPPRRPSHVPSRAELPPLQPGEETYTCALLEMYRENKQDPPITVEDIEKDDRFRSHFHQQRRYYYTAMAACAQMEESDIDGQSFFVMAEEEIYDGIIDTYNGEYATGCDRHRAVMEQSAKISMDAFAGKDNLLRCLRVSAKKGMIHDLVNQDKLPGWVHHDKQDKPSI